MRKDAIEGALELLRLSLTSDGFGLRLASIDAGEVRVILEARPDACLDCLVPDKIMVQILEDAIRGRDSSLRHVELIKVGFEDLTEH